MFKDATKWFASLLAAGLRLAASRLDPPSRHDGDEGVLSQAPLTAASRSMLAKPRSKLNGESAKTLLAGSAEERYARARGKF